MAVDPDKIRELFLKIIELPELEWNAFLDQECADSLESKEYVRSLLDAHVQTSISNPEKGSKSSSFDDPTGLSPSLDLIRRRYA